MLDRVKTLGDCRQVDPAAGAEHVVQFRSEARARMQSAVDADDPEGGVDRDYERIEQSPRGMPTMKHRLWRAYFHPRAWEASGRIYEALGVRRLKEFYFGGRYMNVLVGVVRGRRYRPFRGRGWPRRWLRFTVAVEIGHSCIGFYMLTLAAGHLARGDLRSCAVALAINTLVNVYPVLAQRYNRARLLRIFDLDSTGGPATQRGIPGLEP